MVSKTEAPNVIVFFSDQQRFDSLGCNGQPRDITLRIDRMAREGVNYTMVYTPQLVCGPARAVMQSSLYATQTGCYRNGIPLPYDCNSLAHRMKRAGYHVAYVGKWHFGSVGDAMEVMTAPVPLESCGGYDEYWVAVESLPKTSCGYSGYIFDTEGGKRVFTGYCTDCVTDYVLEYLDACPGDDGKPFFLLLSHIEPHHQPMSVSTKGRSEAVKIRGVCPAARSRAWGRGLGVAIPGLPELLQRLGLQSWTCAG